ncbi:hypothetical protein PPERSA_03617 [Pseudocohnilembus persalinus]|uniref:Uncharacterized protein n=1 Tax=Pseudocohnilembus persalinus TaxID=266149 RepID=A0A0V0QDY1_PSEPJ|nr:hypothetical protein PPERSA_03617 [Pseudocohnilembus persalinus]|eukprot:KRX00396.1 hypothetical protein PPERSA_03617 [Pseudocohnilembus persalinus]
MQKQNVIYGIGGNKKNQTSNQMQQAMGVPSSQSKRSNSLRQGHNSSQNSQQLSQSKLQRNISQTSFQSKQQDAKKSQHSQQTNKYPQKLTEIEEIDLKLQENLKKQEEILLLKNNLNNPNFNSQYKQQLIDQINQENIQKTNINNNSYNNYEKKSNPFEPQNQHLNQNKKDNDNKQFNFFYNHLQPDQNNLINNNNNQEKQKQELENNKELIDIFYQSKKKSLQLKNQFQQNAKYFKEKEAKKQREQNNKYNVQEQENDENQENEHNSYDFYYLFPLKQNKNNPKISIYLQKSQLISSSLYECEEDLIKQFQMVSKYIQYFEKSFQNLQIASQLEKIQEIYENESIQLTNQAPLNFNKILQILLQREKISITDLFRIWYFNNIYQQKMENFTNKIKQMPKELKEFDAKSNQFLSFLQAQKKQQEQNSNQNPNKLLQKFQEQNSLDNTQNNQKLTVQQINLNFNQTADKQFQITLKLNPKQLNQVISGGDEILMENFKEVMKKILSIYSIIQYKGNLIPSIFFADNVEEYLQNTLKNDI